MQSQSLFLDVGGAAVLAAQQQARRSLCSDSHNQLKTEASLRGMLPQAMTPSRYVFIAVLAAVPLGFILGYGVWPHFSSESAPVSAKPAEKILFTPTPAVSDSLPAAAKSPRTATLPDPNALPGERVLRFKNPGDFQRFLDEAKKRGITILGVIPGLNAVRVGAPSDAIITQLLQGIDTAQIGQNYLVSVPSDPSNLTPNAQTPLVPFDQNWIKAMGVNTVDPKWGQGIKVAVVDTGIDPNFTLADAALQSIDLTTPDATNTDSSFSHGTAVASLIAGEDAQLTGMAPASSLLSVKVLNSDGEGDTFTVAEGIVSAVDAGSQIINLSLGSYGDSTVLQDAVVYAQQHGVAIAAAAGNDGTEQVFYPAAYPGVLAVGSIDATLQPAYFSNYGSGLGILAPGVGLAAGQANDQAVSFSGTSASTATVSGALAALLSADRTLTPTQAMGLLETYADDWGAPGWDAQSGYGTVDLGRVLERNTPNITDGAIASQIILNQQGPDQPVVMGITVQNRGTDNIWNGLLNVQVAGVAYNFPVPNLAPTKSEMETVQVYPSQLVNGETVIRSQLTLSGMSDGNPSNNVMQSSLKVIPPASSK
jgi:hypothetical protein